MGNRHRRKVRESSIVHNFPTEDEIRKASEKAERDEFSKLVKLISEIYSVRTKMTEAERENCRRFLELG